MSADYDFVFGTKQESKDMVQQPTAIIVYTAFVILIAVTAFLVGIMFERRTSVAASSELSTFWQVWDILEEDFYGDIPDVESRKYASITGLVSSFSDPYTSFSEPQQAEVRRQQIDGTFGGVGIVVRPNEDLNVMVVSVIPGNPADDVGILPGDVFIEVDSQNVEGFSTDAVAQLVRGEVGTTVDLTMFRPETSELMSFTVNRAIIETPTVFSRILEEENLAYVQLTTFNGVATSQMIDHLEDILSKNVEGVILDLRNNNGGLLSQSVDIADLFLDDGNVLIQRSSDGSEDIFLSDDGELAESIPLVVLVDGGTASAAEVLGGALQDRNRATLIGQSTFGKGVVQLVYNLNDGSQLRVTSSAWYTPNDRAIHQQGLTPDVVVPTTYDNEGNDLVLQAGIDYLLGEDIIGDEIDG